MALNNSEEAYNQQLERQQAAQQDQPNADDGPPDSDGVSKGQGFSLMPPGPMGSPGSSSFGSAFRSSVGSVHADLGNYQLRRPHYGALKIPGLEIPADGSPNAKICAAMKFFADNLSGHFAGDPKFAQFGINTSHAWCAETVNAVMRAAGLQDSGSAMASSVNSLGNRVAAKDIMPGDIVRHIDSDGVHGHTGIVWSVNKDNGSFVMWQGNHSHQAGFSVIRNPAAYATYYRHDGTPGDNQPAPAVANKAQEPAASAEQAAKPAQQQAAAMAAPPSRKPSAAALSG